MQLRIDLVAEMKMAKMMFEMVLSDGHTHRATASTDVKKAVKTQECDPFQNGNSGDLPF